MVDVDSITIYTNRYNTKLITFNSMSIASFCSTVSTIFPKVSCTLLFLWSYYAITFKVILRLPFQTASTVFLFFTTSILLAFTLLLYYLVTIIGPGSPLMYPELRISNYGAEDTPISPPELLVSNSIMVKENGSYRSCSKCKCWKPDRCHHCSSCGKCILKMDHHCPWFGECIGFRNHKFFMQFLIYSSLYLIEITIISCYTLLGFFYYDKWPLKLFSFHILFVFALGVVFSLCVLVFSMFTAYQILQNKTTIESYEYQRYLKNRNSVNLGNIFNLGKKKNWQSVMGVNWYEWLLPVQNKNQAGYGLNFEVNKELYSRLQQERELRERLSSDLDQYRTKHRQQREEAVEALLETL